MKTASEAIADNYKVFAEAFHKGDADAISEMSATDGQLLVPQAPVISGPPAIAEAWRRIVGTGGSSVRVTTAECKKTETGHTRWARSQPPARIARPSVAASTS